MLDDGCQGTVAQCQSSLSPTRAPRGGRGMVISSARATIEKGFCGSNQGIETIDIRGGKTRQGSESFIGGTVMHHGVGLNLPPLT
mmetsp:Transcript_123010/g.262471  ORF Transcript_123010/g.262471 Transcript_123010/m.262471 type:complete len:85 (-) Transcript_123010:40-294(-)